MKLKYEFTMMEMDGETVAVPVGDHADELHGILRLNESAARILELLREETTEEAVIAKLKEEFEPSEELAGLVHDYIERLRAAGLLV